MKITIALTLSLFVSSLFACAAVPKRAHQGDSYSQLTTSNPKEIVFIHGMFVTPKCWSEWEKYFSALGYEVSAPAWPLHDGSIDEARSAERFSQLGKLELDQVVESYAEILKNKKSKPIIIGHSMGGLVAQILLTKGLASAAVAIDSAPPKGLFVLSLPFIRSNWGAIDPFASEDEPIRLSLKHFSYAFLNADAPETREKIYEEFYVPESRRVGKAPTKKIGEVDDTVARGPLLLVAGGADHIIPEALNYKNYKKYSKSPAYTEFVSFAGRDHWTLASPGWENVAHTVQNWLNERFAK